MNNRKLLLSLLAGAVTVLLGIYPGAVAFAESGDNRASVGANVQAQTVGGSGSEEIDSENSHDRTATTTLRREDSSRDANEQGDDEDNGNNEEVNVDHESALQATTTIENSDEVHNRGELRSFLNHLVKEDNRIANVQVSSSTIETQYSLPARFLWAIPASIPAQISVGSDGSVNITYPWYAFLFAKHDDEIKSQITQAASSTIDTSASTALSASVQAHLLNLILTALKGN